MSEIWGSRFVLAVLLLWPATVWADIVPDREREPEPKWECKVPGEGVQPWRGYPGRCAVEGDACFLRFDRRKPVFGTCISVDCLPISDGEWSVVQRMWCANTRPARVDEELEEEWIERGESTCPEIERASSGEVKKVVIVETAGVPDEVRAYDCTATLWERVTEEPTAVFAILWGDESGRTLLISAGSVLTGLVLGIVVYRRRE